MKKSILISFAFFASGMWLVLLLFTGCKQDTTTQTLKEAFKDDFLIGVALTGNQILGKEPEAIEVVKKEFNSVVPENAFKWDTIHPELNKYDFEQGDSVVAFAERNNMAVIGHTLLWHAQTPKWVFEDSAGNPVSRDTLLKRMHDHIFTVVSRYKGRIHGWDVVNEPIAEDGTLRKTKWLEIIGEDYIQKAFEFAREADPDVELYLNDYNIEMAYKRKVALLSLLNDLKAKNVKVDAIGIQGHWHLDIPPLEEIDSAIRDYSALGLKVMITEFDINVLPRPENHTGAQITDIFALTEVSNPYPTVLPDSMQQILANRYTDMFKIFLKHTDAITRVTFWGLHDGQSWLNNWPIPGRTNYPLLFDRELNPKPAYYSVIELVKQDSTNN